MNVFSVSCAKLFCIQPYLVNQFRTWFHCLRIQVLWFIVSCTIHIWVSLCITILVCQFRIIIKQLVACDIEFFFRNNVFLWIELRFFRWFHRIVELFVRCVLKHVHNSCHSRSVMFDFYFNCCNHVVIRHSSIRSSNFFHSVSEGITSVRFCKFKWLEGNLRDSSCCVWRTVLHSLNCDAIFFQYECKFVFYKISTI